MNYSFSTITSVFAATAISTASIAIGISIPAEAATFTDRAVWQDVVREALPSEAFTGVTSTNQGIINFSDFSDLPIVSTATPDTASRRHRIVNNAFRISLNNQNASIYNIVTWTFTRNDVFGFFADFRNVDDGVTLTAKSRNGTTEIINLFSAVGGTPGAVNVNGSFGILGDTAYDSIAYAYTGQGSARFAIDNLAVAVPSPALLPGLVGIGVAAIRKRRKSEAAEEV